VVVDADTEPDFLHGLPVELMWGVGPITKARLAEIGVLTIGQLAKTPGWSLEQLLGPAAGEKLAALAWNRDPREIRTHRRARSAGAQSAIGKNPAEERVFRPTLRHLEDRIGARLRARSFSGRTVTVRVRFADLRSVTRSATLDAPIAATAILAEIADELVRTLLAHRPTRGASRSRRFQCRISVVGSGIGSSDRKALLSLGPAKGRLPAWPPP
jgi:DNA polymerase-4